MSDLAPDVPPPRYEQRGGWKHLICDEPEWLARPAAWGIDVLPEAVRGRKWNLYNAHHYGWLAEFIACPVCRPHVQELFGEDGPHVPTALKMPEGDWRTTRERFQTLYASNHPKGKCDAQPIIRSFGQYQNGVLTHPEFFNRAVDGLMSLVWELDHKDRQSHRQNARTQKERELALELVGPNPFRPVAFAPEWRTDTAVTLARQMYESREFSAMPILADALQDAGCDSEAILAHCRDTALAHVRGCWVIDLVLGKS